MAIFNWKKYGTEEYVTPRRIAQLVDRSVDDLKKMGFFDDIPFKMDLQNARKYKYTNCLHKLHAYGLTPPTKTHPNAKWRPYEIVNDLNINPITYKKYVKKGLIVEQDADEHGKFVYYKDYDYFLKNYVPVKMLKHLVYALNMRDSAAFIGMTVGKLRGKCQTGKAQVVAKVSPTTGVRRFKWMTRDQIIQYVNSTLENAKERTKYLLRKIPLPDQMSTNLACVYMKVSRRTLTKYVFYGWLHPIRVVKKYKKWNFYDKKELDELYQKLDRRYYYGEDREWYSRFNIRNKFGKSDYWIDQLVVGKCRVVVPTVFEKNRKPDGNKVVSVEEYAQLNAEAKAKGQVGYPLWGWVQEDVDAIVASGAHVDPKMELSEFRKKCMDRLDKTNYRKVNAQKKQCAKKGHKTRRLHRNDIIVDLPEIDSVEIAIRAALYENELRAEDRRHEAYAKVYAKNWERNQLRKVLGLEERPDVTLTNDDILRHSTTPCVVTILYRRRAGNSPVLYKKTSKERDEVVYVTSDKPVTMKRKNEPQQSIFLNISRAADKINRSKAKVMPSWIVLAHTSSIIYDMSFIKKLENVPAEYGAVAPFGYEYFLPDGTWTRCPNTYGMYSEFSARDELMTTRVVGNSSAVGNHEVAVLDGPFIAIRGGYLPYLKRLHMLYRFGDGRGCVPYVISMIMHRLGIKMLQIEVDSSWCVDVNKPFTPLEWNQIEPKLVALGKSLVPTSHLKPKIL